MEKSGSIIEEKRKAYVLGLIEKVQLDDEESQKALEELYGCANGGDPTAREFVNLQDQLQDQLLQAIDDAAV